MIKDHEFYGKWAPIISHEESGKEGYASYKGYVKCDISVQCTGDTIQVYYYIKLFLRYYTLDFSFS